MDSSSKEMVRMKHSLDVHTKKLDALLKKKPKREKMTRSDKEGRDHSIPPRRGDFLFQSEKNVEELSASAFQRFFPIEKRPHTEKIMICYSLQP